MKFSPIYDCGSCLNPMIEDEELSKLNDVELKNLAINCYSCIKENGKKINYMTFMKKMSNEDCNDAIRRVFEKISNTRKSFYKRIIEIRYKILKEVYNKIR